jgi:hypothetical protein
LCNVQTATKRRKVAAAITFKADVTGVCNRCRRTAVATIEPAVDLPPAIAATNPSEIERAIFLRSLTEWDQFWVEIIIRSGIAASVRDALVEHRAVAEARR